MKYTGIVLTSLAGAGVIAGVVSLAVADSERSSCRDCDFAGLGETVIGGFCLGGAGLLAIVGIPLWAVGASETLVPAEEYAATTEPGHQTEYVPVVHLGLGSLELEGKF